MRPRWYCNCSVVSARRSAFVSSSACPSSNLRNSGSALDSDRSACKLRKSSRPSRKRLSAGRLLLRRKRSRKIGEDVVGVADVKLFQNPLKKVTSPIEEFHGHGPDGGAGGLLGHLRQLHELRAPLPEHLQEREVRLTLEFLVIRARGRGQLDSEARFDPLVRQLQKG